MNTLGFDILGVGGSLLSKTWMLQRQFNWQLVMPHNFDGIIGYLVSQYCQEIEFGNYNVTEVSKLNYGAFQRFYAGTQGIDQVTLTFICPTDNSVTKYFYSWYNNMIDENGYYYPKNNYAKDIFVMFYDRSGVSSFSFRLKGTFVSTRPKIKGSWLEDDIMKLSVVLNVDSIEMESFIGSITQGITEGIEKITGGAVTKVVDVLGGISGVSK